MKQKNGMQQAEMIVRKWLWLPHKSASCEECEEIQSVQDVRDYIHSCIFGQGAWLGIRVQLYANADGWRDGVEIII